LLIEESSVVTRLSLIHTWPSWELGARSRELPVSRTGRCSAGLILVLARQPTARLGLRRPTSANPFDSPRAAGHSLRAGFGSHSIPLRRASLRVAQAGLWGTRRVARVAGFGAWAVSSPKQKRPPGGGLFFFYSISSEYQIESINRPSIFEGIRM